MLQILYAKRHRCVEHKDILSFEEIRQIAVCGARLSITKIRLTLEENPLRQERLARS